ncbi:MULTISPECIES: hypothetical protein [Pseudomonadota]|uniref:Uncharacterized protein n=1 Tax=Halopseudomonas formosensis TaxID=1002526 RepID=A0A1I5ZJ53_9GAMM|nr:MULTISPECIES: hypothetical protein [Pseudomonadota]OFS87179.1 hypothetical protein HMPREF3144_04010 [Oligella sp. HMSC05A10]OFV51259.1 hypothetical protein HMPREF3179_01050 [Oligella sp. HMSC09E12]SFQ56496.1 hypothetical protein SAMN05216578_10171 [Halopseudomonas formosensis]
MSEIMESNYAQMKSYVERNKFSFQEKDEQGCKRLDVQNGKAKCVVKVYSTGTIQIQGAESKLKAALSQAKEAVENEENIGEMLPFEIERFPEVLRENIPDVDPIIVRFIEEAIVTIKAGSNLGCAFLLGGASEKAIYLLIDAYTQAIPDQAMRDRFISKTSKKFISKVFEEFKASWKSSINKPHGYGWTNDIEVKIEQIFQFCRICRNESGHPHLPPNLDKGVLLANMGQFVKYIEDMYGMINYYKENNVQF